MARYADKVTSAMLETKPDLAFVFTHVWVSWNPVNPPASVRQLVESLRHPTPGALGLDFSFESRYLCTVPGIANWSCMATRGNGWGDYSLRDPAAFTHESRSCWPGAARAPIFPTTAILRGIRGPRFTMSIAM